MQRLWIDEALWTMPRRASSPHGAAGAPDEAPADPAVGTLDAAPANGARFLALADGEWREGEGGFERTFLLFDDSDASRRARECWRKLGKARGHVERHFWKQEDGRWVDGGPDRRPCLAAYPR